MNCSERGCVFPELRAGLCLQHLRQREEETRPDLARKIIPEPKADKKEVLRPPKSEELTVTTPKSVREDNGWTWEYISENEAEIWKFLAPVWGWLYRALEDLKEGHCMKITIPPEQDIDYLRHRIACSVRSQFNDRRWRIRKGADLKHIVVIQNGTWRERSAELKERNSVPVSQEPAK